MNGQNGPFTQSTEKNVITDRFYSGSLWLDWFYHALTALLKMLQFFMAK
jgi:hypothetical protein